MPGRPHRHKILDSIPVDLSCDAPMTDEELRELSSATVQGLLGRLQRRDPREAQDAEAGMRLANILFPAWVKSEGLKKAKDLVSALIATQPGQWSEGILKALDLHLVTLLREHAELVNTMPSRSNPSARHSWLRRQRDVSPALIRDSAQESDTDLSERILAERHGTNRGKIHKLLAMARKILKSELATTSSST